MLNKNPKQDIEIRSRSRVGTLVGIVLVFIALVGYLFYSKPLSGEVSVLESEISSKSGEIEEIKGKIDEFEKAEKELGISSEVQRLESLKAIPAQMYQDEVIRDVIQIIDTYDIELKSLSFGQGSSDYENVEALSVNASFEGNYGDLVSFLEAVEQNARIFKVDSISVQVNQLDILDIKRATFSLSMKAFFQKNNQ